MWRAKSIKRNSERVGETGLGISINHVSCFKLVTKLIIISGNGMQMNELEKIEKIIKKIPKGKIFLPESICKKYPSKAVRQVLLRLRKKKEIISFYRGMYVRPEKSRFFPSQPVLPSPEKIIKAISKKTGEIISVHGAVALNQIGLSTQVPAHPIYYTSGRSRYIKINENYQIKLFHINPKKVIMPGTVTGHVTAALFFEGKRYLNPKIVKNLHNRLGDKYFQEVLIHVDKMPTWMSKVFLQYQKMKPDDPGFKEDEDEYYSGN